MRTTTSIKVLIADANPTFSKGIKTIIHNGIVAEFEFDEVRYFAELVDKTYKHEFDLYIVNTCLDGLKFDLLKNRFVQIKTKAVLLLCDQIGHGEIELSRHIKNSGILSRNCKVSEIIRAINSLFDNHKYYCEEAIEFLTNGTKNYSTNKENPFNITNREREILQLIADEYSSEEIAEILSISKRTVEGHRNSLKSKLQVKSTIGLVKYFLSDELGFKQAM